MRTKLPIILAITTVMIFVYMLAGAGAATKKVNVNVNAGPLSLVMPGADANLNAVTLDGTNKSTTGTLGNVRVIDARGTGAGWYVTLSATDFIHDTTPTNTIAATGNFDVATATVTNVSGNGGVTGGIGNLGGGGISVMDSGSPMGRGINETSPELDLIIPAEAFLGTYSATVTGTLISY